MNLELQEYTETAESNNLLKSMLAGALFGGAFYLLNWWLEGRSHTIPPIIIKSDYNEEDPIVCETSGELQETNAFLRGLDSEPSPLAQKAYKLLGFGITQIVRVIRYNETGGNYPTVYFPSRRGIKVGIWLQYLQNDEWKWEGTAGGASPTADPQILILGRTNDFTIISDPLSKNLPNNHSKRKFKHKYNKNKKWRFGKVKVYDFSDGEFITSENDIYILAFDNHLH